MVEHNEFHEHVITVYGNDGNVIKQYTGKMHIWFSDKKNENCIHFVDEDNNHHRIYGNNLIIVEDK